ncbi:hypothetical protein EB796_000495 [Bugula neritina]|uniref:F-BAR domain-containing protein n=1 Tax=Bugula neritina TaxID=10212 RepID=A0A7J7KSM8_BUGNE|nr:hypothetical protein EB796_000495 [Bugula neritina]
MQYTYQDLYQACQFEAIQEHINGTLRLAKLAVSEFVGSLSTLNDRFSSELKNLVSHFQQKTSDELLTQKNRYLFDKSTLLGCWEKLLNEVTNDAKRHEIFSTKMSSQTVKKLLCSINCTQAQVVELSSFKGKLDEMCDSTAGDLHKSYEHYRDCYSVAKKNETEKLYQSCVDAHNQYIIKLISFNKLQREYHTQGVPQVLQQLESTQTETMLSISDSIQTLVSSLINMNREQITGYEGVNSLCEDVDPKFDISRFVKSQNPTQNNYQQNLQSFVPGLSHSHAPRVRTITTILLC